ncbi:MAG TPA: YraN family protein [Jatrophihabitans sp.]|jgi:putative endonuclease
MRVKDAVGRYGEELAASHLGQQGMEILARNWRCPEGELDIIGREDGALIFVEVKTRSTTAFGDPAEAITPAKAQRIHRLALRWLAEQRAGGNSLGNWSELRFDVVTIVRLAEGGPKLRHLRGAF